MDRSASKRTSRRAPGSLLSCRSPRKCQAPPHATTMHRVLIVDDRAVIRESLQGVLEDEDYQSPRLKAANPAWNCCHRKEFDVVLLDVWLPGIDGLETLQKIREDGLGSRGNHNFGARRPSKLQFAPPSWEPMISSKSRFPSIRR